ncbi:MAG: guanylate kinase [Lachnospiraceae bacterium]|nr:guanylate kinase [Lachnospiraceae bacterium]
MKDTGFLIVLSGFAGSGKGTIIKELLSRHPDEYVLSVSATTRQPRPGEAEGREYFFETAEAFEQMIANEELLEYARYVDNYYGTPRSYVEEQLAACRNVILEIEIQGALQIKERFPETLLLFVAPPSAQILRNRLVGRGTETPEVIRSRLTRAVEEADGCEVYDYLIINDDLDLCVDEVHHIIRSERCRMRHRLSRIEAIKQDLKKYVKGEQI